MPRPRLPLGTWGQITLTHLKVQRSDPKARRHGSKPKPKIEVTIIRARARYRDFDGCIRIMTAYGDTQSQARARLMDKLASWSRGGVSSLHDSTTIGELLDRWLEEARDEIRHSGARARSPETIDRYEDVIELKLKPALGKVRIHELTTGNADRVLKLIKAKTPTQARHSRIILRSAYDLAIRHDLLTRNPIEGTAPIHIEKKEPRALAASEIKAVRMAVRARTQASRPGPRSSNVLSAVVDLLIASGLRIAEALALRVSDVDLEAGTLTITGQIVSPKRGPSYRKPEPKTLAGYRRLHLPSFAVKMLKNQIPLDAHPGDFIFQTRTGRFLTPSQLRSQLRAALRSAGLDSTITPHSFRRTMATALANSQDFGDRAAAGQLGHSSPRSTERYIARIADGPDAADFIQAAYEAALHA